MRRETPPTTQAIIIVNYVGRFKENSKGLLKYYASSSNQNTTLAKLTVCQLCHQKPKKISLSGIGLCCCFYKKLFRMSWTHKNVTTVFI